MNETPTEPQTGSNKLSIPIAIVVAGALIAGAIYYVNRDIVPRTSSDENPTGTLADINVAPVSNADRILGNPNAKIVIVEYSDTECPFCKQFHTTMHRLIDEYGRDGDVAWVYRHLPLEQLHSKAPKQAEATECAAELGGNTGFWNYTDRLFEITPSNNGLDMALLPQIAEDVGLNRIQFETCLNSNKYADQIAQAIDTGIDILVQTQEVTGQTAGTPLSFVLVDGEVVAPLSGAYPYETLQPAIENILSGNISTGTAQ